MSTLLAKIQVFPGKETLFEEVMAFMYQQTHDTEKDVLRYEYWRGREPGFYYCLLSFPDAVAFWRHQASDHHEAEMQRFGECIAELDLEVLDPVVHASPLPATRPIPCPEDESDAVRQQSENFPIALQDWWRTLRVQ
ncbi:MAG: antibiotic biosynthesis monooxygenase [Halioglobus sp.]|nr:antibiotic biosynthesis monooxygenase [Halioglobus sp.]